MERIEKKSIQLESHHFDIRSKRRLGSGGVAKVFAMEYRGQEVAVKIPYYSESLESEIPNLVRIAHRNIVSFYGTVELKNRICLVFEMAPKGTVDDFLRNTATDSDRKLLRASRLTWMCDIARAVAYLHSDAPEPIVHGDIKGSNVLIFNGSDGTFIAKITDFGQSQPLYRTHPVNRQGTLLWAAPEVLSRKCQSLKSDVWSFGATAVELISERLPYFHKHNGNDQKMCNVLDGVRTLELNPLTDLEATWPPGVLEVVKQCFEEDYKKRPEMKDVLINLTRAQSAGPQSAGPQSAGSQSSGPQSAGPQSAGPQSAGPQSAGPQSSGPQSAGPQSAGPQSAGPQSAGPQSAEPQSAPVAIRFSSFNPNGTSEGQSLDLSRERSFRQALRSAKRLFSQCRPGQDSVSYCPEGEYLRTEERRNYVHCFDRQSNQFLNVDLRDGTRVESSTKTFSVMRFLADNSDLPRCPSLTPHVVIFNDSKLLKMKERRTEAAPKNGLHLKRFIAFLYGLKRGKKLLWRISGNEVFTCTTSDGTVVEEPREESQQKQKYFFLLLEDGDKLPLISVPEGRCLIVFHRLGAQVEVRNGCLVASLATNPWDLESWVMPATVSTLQRAISAEARRR